jgi:hypothetical protein
MGLDVIAQTMISVVTPLITLITFFSRRRRLRNEIRENLSLLIELDKDEVLKEHTPAAMRLRGKIVIDVAKLSGQPLGTPKKPVPKGSVILAALLCAGLSYWTYYVDRDTFIWFSSIPGVFALLFAISIFGMFRDREIPPPEEPSEDKVADETATTADEDVNGSGAKEAQPALVF